MSAVADANRGDFTANPRVLVVTLMAVFVGAASAFVALALTKLIGFFTNLFYYQRIATGDFTSPAGHHLGVWSVFIPVICGLLIGLMAVWLHATREEQTRDSGWLSRFAKRVRRGVKGNGGE
jgi:H+/Cl- antiporter ClcA